MARGNPNGNPKLNAAQVRAIRKRYAERNGQRPWACMRVIAGDYEMSIMQVYRIVTGRAWQGVEVSDG